MAFRQTVFRLAGPGRSDVAPALKKLWTKHYKVDGEVTQHLSPFEQNIVSPMFKDAHYKIFNKIKDFVLEAGPGLACGIAVFYWSEVEHKKIAMHHRS